MCGPIRMQPSRGHLRCLSRGRGRAPVQIKGRNRGDAAVAVPCGNQAWACGVGSPSASKRGSPGRQLHSLGKFQGVKVMYLLLNFLNPSQTPREDSLSPGSWDREASRGGGTVPPPPDPHTEALTPNVTVSGDGPLRR